MSLYRKGQIFKKLWPKMVQNLQNLGKKHYIFGYKLSIRNPVTHQIMEYFPLKTLQIVLHILVKKVFYITGSRKILHKLHAPASIYIFWKKLKISNLSLKTRQLKIKTTNKEKIPNIADLQSQKSRKFQKDGMSLLSMVIIWFNKI